MAESLTGMLRIRSGQVQYRRLNGPQWRDLVPLNTLLALGGQTPVDPGPTDPPPTDGGGGEGAFSQSFTPDGRDLTADGWDSALVFNYPRPLISGGAMVDDPNVDGPFSAARRYDFPVDFRCLVTFTGSPPPALYLRGSRDVIGKASIFVSSVSTGGYAVALGDQEAPVPVNPDGSYTLEVRVVGTVIQVNGVAVDYAQYNLDYNQADTGFLILVYPGGSITQLDAYPDAGPLTPATPPAPKITDYSAYSSRLKSPSVGPGADGWTAGSDTRTLAYAYAGDRWGVQLVGFNPSSLVRADRGLAGAKGVLAWDSNDLDIDHLVIGTDSKTFANTGYFRFRRGQVEFYNPSNSVTYSRNHTPGYRYLMNVNDDETIRITCDGSEIFSGANPFAASNDPLHQIAIRGAEDLWGINVAVETVGVSQSNGIADQIYRNFAANSFTYLPGNFYNKNPAAPERHGWDAPISGRTQAYTNGLFISEGDGVNSTTAEFRRNTGGRTGLIAFELFDSAPTDHFFQLLYNGNNIFRYNPDNSVTVMGQPVDPLAVSYSYNRQIEVTNDEIRVYDGSGQLATYLLPSFTYNAGTGLFLRLGSADGNTRLVLKNYSQRGFLA